ncbi:hypothetical protein H4R35_001154 [Dimargaris xerosporica]|nr:hypothetical protein H4R35_001154 [Dimargaris xerosporica]
MDGAPGAKRFLTPAQLKRRQKHRQAALPRSASTASVPTLKAARSESSTGREPPLPLHEKPRRFHPYPTKSSTLVRAATYQATHTRSPSASLLRHASKPAAAATHPNPFQILASSKSTHGDENPFQPINQALGLDTDQPAAQQSCIVTIDQPVIAPTLPQLLSQRALSVPVALAKLWINPPETAKSTTKFSSTAIHDNALTADGLPHMTCSQPNRQLSWPISEVAIRSRHFRESSDSGEDSDRDGDQLSFAGAWASEGSDDEHRRLPVPNTLINGSSHAPTSPPIVSYWDDIDAELAEDPSLFSLRRSTRPKSLSLPESLAASAHQTINETAGPTPLRHRARLTRMLQPKKLEGTTTAAILQAAQSKLQQRTAIGKPSLKGHKKPALIQQYPAPPVDWWLRLGVVITSKVPFDWLSTERDQPDGLGLTLFTRSPANICQSTANAAEQLQAHLHHWRYNPPRVTESYAKTIAKVLTQRKRPTVEEKQDWDFLHQAEQRARRAFNSAFTELAAFTQQTYFYYSNAEFNAIFISSGSSNPASLEARLSPSTAGLRKKLGQAGITFATPKLPLVAHDPGEMADTDVVARTLAQKKYDGQMQSTLFFHGSTSVRGLVQFLLRWTDPRSERRARCGITLVAPFPFLHGSLEKAALELGHKSSGATQRLGATGLEQCYTLTIRGYLLPSAWCRIQTLLAQLLQGEYTTVPTKDTLQSSLVWLNLAHSAHSIEPACALPTLADSTADSQLTNTATTSLVTKLVCQQGQFSWDTKPIL